MHFSYLLLWKEPPHNLVTKKLNGFTYYSSRFHRLARQPGGSYTFDAMTEMSAWLAVGPRRQLASSSGGQPGSGFFSPGCRTGLSLRLGWPLTVWWLGLGRVFQRGSMGAGPVSQHLAGLQVHHSCWRPIAARHMAQPSVVWQGLTARTGVAGGAVPQFTRGHRGLSPAACGEGGMCWMRARSTYVSWICLVKYFAGYQT